MADEPTTVTTQDEQPKLVPASELAAERKARTELEARLSAIEAERKAADEKAAADAGEYRKLYEPLKAEHETTKSRLAEYEAREVSRIERVKTRNEERIKALPEKAAKALLPIAAKLSPDDLADWMDTSLSSLLPDTTEIRPAGTRVATGSTGKEDPIPAASTAEWERYGRPMSERDWYEKNWKPRHKGK